MSGTAKTSEEEFFKVYRLDTVVIPTNKPICRIDEQDLIYRTEQGKIKSIVNKIKEINATGQPILVGTVSIEKNEELSNYLTREGIKHNLLNAKNHENEGEIIAQAGKKFSVTIATNMAGRGVDIKLGGVPFSQEKHDEVKALGGLMVIGTERHEARRIDNQLRGRAGRQGDPGLTQFFVSMEDSLMRIFASDTVKKMMERLGLPEDQPIKNSMITRALENAQSKIEGFNFDARKHLLEFDSVVNIHRTSIYARRLGILLGDAEIIQNEVNEIVARGGEKISAQMKEKENILGADEWKNILRRMLLQSIDTFRVEHLETMNYLRSSVNLRAYGQRDPLIEYKREALILFKNMKEAVYDQVMRMIPNVGQGAFQKEEERLKETVKKAKLVSGKTNPDEVTNPVPAGDKIGRNEIVTIEKDGQKMEMKYKKAEAYLAEGWKISK